MNMVKTAALLGGLTALFVLVGGLIGGGTGMVIAFVAALGINLYAWWNSGEMALRAHRARPVDRRTAPDLYRVVEVLAMNAGLPTPSVHVIESPQPNAFATGRDPKNAAVAVTTGLLNSLGRDELAGVIAHELAHIRNRDTLIMTIAASVAGAISMLAQFGFLFGGGRDRNPLALVGVLLAVILAPVAAMLIQMTISRTREFSADRDGGEICGNPLWLADALRRLAAQRTEMISAETHPATAHLFIVNPLSGRRFDGLFSTHPPLEARIAELEAQAAEMRRTSSPDGGGAAAAAVRAGDRPGSGVPRVSRGGGPWR